MEDSSKRLPPLQNKKRTKLACAQNHPGTTVQTGSSEVSQNITETIVKHIKKGKGTYRYQSNDPSPKSGIMKPPSVYVPLDYYQFGSGNNDTGLSAESFRQHIYIVMQQLKKSENQQRLLQDHLKLNDKKVEAMTEAMASLEQKVSIMERKLLEERSTHQFMNENYPRVLTKCNFLEKKIKSLEDIISHLEHDMEITSNSRANSVTKVDNSNSFVGNTKFWRSESSLPEEFKIDFSTLLERIEELNADAGLDETELCYTNNGATFQRALGLPLILYANGLFFNNSTFRSYKDEETQQFIQDLLDGYFPTEIQQDYPEGAPFQVDDRHHEEYREKARKWVPFSGKGYVLGRRTFTDNDVTNNQNGHSILLDLLSPSGGQK